MAPTTAPIIIGRESEPPPPPEPPSESGSGVPITIEVILSGMVSFQVVPGPNTLLIPLVLVRRSLKSLAALTLTKLTWAFSRTLAQMGGSTVASVAPPASKGAVAAQIERSDLVHMLRLETPRRSWASGWALELDDVSGCQESAPVLVCESAVWLGCELVVWLERELVVW
eukprot:CAMPEP_0114502506 /NCGR_PEP_ID=MMETSP0109-20121206/9136_1 /TAXON_ID=29199 /ORGANISM="Chlorarachnion reptans, Strain CCCM449" /LENGTH=169 /DNA_ID=CAMNT_0001680443 /DNA_START=117 /DNA_END=627 /DNA_ORIENTATION=-